MIFKLDFENNIFMFKYKLVLIGFLLLFFSMHSAFAQTFKKQIYYTKSCDTISRDTMVCIKCLDPDFTIQCMRYACAIQGDCILIGPVIPNSNRLKDVRAPQTKTKKK